MKKISFRNNRNIYIGFAGTGAVVFNEFSHGAISHTGIAITFGLVVLAMIYTLGDISGAHLNPSVTIAFCVDKRIKLVETVKYIISQLIGATLASLFLKFCFPFHETLGSTFPSIGILPTFLFELLLPLYKC